MVKINNTYKDTRCIRIVEGFHGWVEDGEVILFVPAKEHQTKYLLGPRVGTEKVCAVVVVFFSDQDVLYQAIKVIRKQVSYVVIVDNGSDRSAQEVIAQLVAEGGVGVVSQPENVGVAAAHNIGIKWAKKKKFTHVLLMDQDTIPSAGMVSALLNAERELKMAGVLVAAVGPRFVDPRTELDAPFIKRDGWRIQKVFCMQNGERFVEADYLISSGSLIALDTLRDVGGMDDELFIDYIDIEWGLRAGAKGYRCFGVCEARMTHCIGETPLRLPIIGMKVPIHSPLRHYYHFRNAILLYRREYVPWKWIGNDGYRLVLKFIVYSLFPKNRLQHFLMMMLGIVHGLKGRSGKYGAGENQVVATRSQNNK